MARGTGAPASHARGAERGRRRTRRHHRGPHPPYGANGERGGSTASGVTCATADYVAASALRALRLIGLRAPDDVAVVGYDDERVAATVDPPLTTMHRPLRELGAAAVDMLRSRIAGDDVPSLCVLESTLVIRASA